MNELVPVPREELNRTQDTHAAILKELKRQTELLEAILLRLPGELEEE